MSHDIRTPLNVIVGMYDLALKDLTDQKQVRESLHVIKAASEILTNLTNDILDLNRLKLCSEQQEDEMFNCSKQFPIFIEMVKTIFTKKN